MALTPVTNRQYASFVEATGIDPPTWWDKPDFDDPEQPVVGVNWFEARRYCRWLSRESGFSIRLPTEAEREKAARGGRLAETFPWGEAIDAGGHPELDGPLSGPDPVRRLSPNGFGLYNMGDNVHEWCLDGYDSAYYSKSPARNPCAPPGGRRSARGGSWRHAIVVTPCAGRSSLPPRFHYSDFGFRWVSVP